MKRKLMSMFLALTMILAMVPTVAMAATTVPVKEPKLTSTVIDGERHDSLEYTFQSDPAAIGLWKVYGVIDTVDQSLDPDKLTFGTARCIEDGIYLGQSVYPDGTIKFYSSSWILEGKWTDGYIIRTTGSGTTVPAYQIKVIGDRTFMIIEWKSGDYIYDGGRISCYYVMEKVSTDPNANIEIPGAARDKLSVPRPELAQTHDADGILHETPANYTFESDPRAIGEWQSCDYSEFVGYNPDDPVNDNSLQEFNALYAGQSIYPDGSMVRRHRNGDVIPATWSANYMVWSDWQVVPSYEIKEIGGKTYMFLEWKNYDYQKDGKVYGYYILEKVSDVPASID